MPILPLLATIWPTFTACVSGALISTRKFGVPASTISTERPAANITSPCGLVMMPEFLTSTAIR